MSPPPAPIVPDESSGVADLTAQLVALQAQVVLLHHQLTELSDQLRHEQQWRASHVSVRMEHSQDFSLQSSLEHSCENSQDLSVEKSQETPLESFLENSLQDSLDSLARSAEKSLQSHLLRLARTTANEADPALSNQTTVLPLVEYGGQDTYVVISPKQGLLSFQPDSPEWFAWLATILSFRFIGKLGRLTVHRGSTSSERSWRASRHIRNRSYNLSLGKTYSLTIDVLEQAAASLQVHLN